MTIKQFLEIKKNRASELGKEAYKTLAEEVIQEWIKELPFNIYIVTVVYPDFEGNTVMEAVFERAKTSAEAVRLVAERKLPPITLMDSEKEYPYEDYGIMEVKKFNQNLVWTDKDVENILDFVFTHYYSEQIINGTNMTNNSNANKILKMLENRYKYKSKKLEYKYRNK